MALRSFWRTPDMSWTRRLRNLFGQQNLERQIDDELAFHIAERVDELVAEGWSEGDARRQALLQFGSYTRRKEDIREIDLLARLDTIVRDVRFGVRTLLGSPAFTATAVLSLALGIGANTAIFSIIDALMLRSLPVEDPARLVKVEAKGIGGEFTNPIWEQMRDHQQAFSGMLAWGEDRFDLAQGGESRFARGLWVSGDFFRVLGVPALQGRVFTTREDRRGTPPVAVISYGFWKRNFASDPSVVGKTVSLNRHVFEVVGVTPPWFNGLEVDKRYDVAIPITCEPILHTDHSSLDERSDWWLQIMGRLAPGRSPQQSAAQLNTYAPALLQATVAADWPVDAQEEFLKASFRLTPAATGFSDVRAQYRTALFALMGIAALVLFIACANVANLLLARASVRRRELAVRLALGASRIRVVLQLLTESLLLSVAGTAAGFLLALAGSRLLIQLISTAGDPLAIDLSPDATLLAFSAGTAILTALLFGLAPAFLATRGDLNHSLKEHARGNVAGASRFHAGKILVAGQIALSLVLLVAAGLFLGTLRNLLTTDLGFNRHGVLLVSAQYEENAVAAERRAGINAEVVSRLRAIPGVVSGSSSLRTPITNFGWNSLVDPEGYRPRSRMDALVWLNRVSPGYFTTMDSPLRLGRDFAGMDGLTTPKVMIVGEATARRFFGFANPLGKTIAMDGPGRSAKKEIYQVIGVVKDSKYQRIGEDERLTAFVVSTQDTEPSPQVSFEVRGAGAVAPLQRAVRSAIMAVNSHVSLEFRDLETQVNESVMQPRVVALLSTAFGLLALLLAAVGLYGVTAYGVSRRRNEIGIRIALGARRRSVIWLALRDVGITLIFGIAVGLAGSLGLSRFIKSLLFGVQPNDPRELASAAAILVLCGFVAAWVPARRAAAVDPLTSLREE
jgi:putative ABC transport system permease protein